MLSILPATPAQQIPNLRSLVELKSEVNRLHRLAQTTFDVGTIRRVGELLATVKRILGRVDFNHWVAANCKFGPTLAQNYLRFDTGSGYCATMLGLACATLSDDSPLVSKIRSRQELVARLRKELKEAESAQRQLHLTIIEAARAERAKAVTP